MLEYIREDPSIQLKIEVSNNFKSCIYCGIQTPNVIAECGECGHKFCNGWSEIISDSHIIYHMRSKKSRVFFIFCTHAHASARPGDKL